jgi:signal transduction histidine kinase
MGRLVAVLAHDIRNALGVTTGELSLMLHGLRAGAAVKEAELVEQLGRALAGAERVTAIANELAALGGPGGLRVIPLVLRDCLDGALRLVRSEVLARARLVIDWPSLPLVAGNHARLVQVFLTLLATTAQALPEKDRSRNLVRVSASGGPKWVVVDVYGHGAHVAEDAPADSGLSTCRELVTSMGGTLSAEDRAGCWVVLRLSLLAASP